MRRKISNNGTSVASLIEKVEAARKLEAESLHAKITELLGETYQIVPIVQLGETVLPVSQVLSFPSGWTVGVKG